MKDLISHGTPFHRFSKVVHPLAFFHASYVFQDLLLLMHAFVSHY